jgi:hypothetical protein
MRLCLLLVATSLSGCSATQLSPLALAGGYGFNLFDDRRVTSRQPVQEGVIVISESALGIETLPDEVARQVGYSIGDEQTFEYNACFWTHAVPGSPDGLAALASLRVTTASVLDREVRMPLIRTVDFAEDLVIKGTTRYGFTGQVGSQWLVAYRLPVTMNECLTEGLRAWKAQDAINTLRIEQDDHAYEWLESKRRAAELGNE